MSNKIYYHEHRGTRTGWDYKIEFIPASADPITTPEYVRLPTGSVKLKKATKKMQGDYYFGLVDAPTADIDIYLADIPETELYDDFFDCIMYPIKKLAVPISELYPIPLTVDIGTYVKISINFKGNDGTDVGYRYFFSGCVRYDNKIKNNPINEVANITITHISKCICDSFNFEYLGIYPDMFGMETKHSEYIYEWLGVADGKGYQVVHSGGNLKYEFVSKAVIDNYIRYVGSQVAKKITRDPNQVFSAQPIFPEFYEQIYDGTGSRGGAIPSENLYLLSRIVYEADGQFDPIGGLLNPYNDKGLHQRYPNSVWDYLKDVYDWAMCRGDMVEDSGFRNSRMFGHSSDTTILLTKKILKDMDLDQDTNVLKTATASMVESYSDDDYADRDNYEAVKQGSRNESEFTIPIIYNNLPTCIQYQYESRYVSTNSQSKTVVRFLSIKPHQLGLYYWEENIPPLASISWEQTSAPVRVHERSRYNFGNGVTSDSLVEITDFPSSDLVIDGNHTAGAMAFVMQNASNGVGLPKIAAESLIKLFGNERQHANKLTVPIEEHTKMSWGGDVGFVWWYLDTRYEISWTEYRQHWHKQHKYWRPLEIEIDFETEMCALTLYPESINAE